MNTINLMIVSKVKVVMTETRAVMENLDLDFKDTLIIGR